MAAGKNLWQPEMDGHRPSQQPFLRKKRKRLSCAFFFAIKNYEGENRRKHEKKKNM